MTALKKEFPALDSYTYLNTASCGLLSQSLVDWRHQHDRKLLAAGSEFRDQHRAHVTRIKSTVARIFNASENEIALVPNFSFGCNTFLEGLPRKQKILLLDQDYPSVNWAVEHRDFDVCYAAIDANLEQNIEQAIATHQPDVFMFSIVQYLSGIKIDMEFLTRIKAYHPNLLLVADGTQYLGTEPFSFADSPFDVLGASGYKWLLAGYGNGIFMVKEGIHQQVYPSTIGFNSAEAAYSKREEIDFIRHFEPGHQDTLNFGSLEQSLLSLESIGLAKIQEKLSMLKQYAFTKFSEANLLELAILARKDHAPIYTIKGNETLFRRFKEHGIICSQRGNGIRVSFHYYNTQKDLDQLLDLV
ncbi:aminotransferase class V-fold PLP-dependent enzyme [Candidatus Ulvibacter alkanivorans]|uniref:aminotransferase class V-fold PLP-dependent enzyme n=1 Tax=Candidatus Ulvibacter alkanivorans TaxID=2267620 RepID=UPI000DF44422|nr:aminotransferase class V-fold PLP-dependent enzyme [Candidatus Ulvibacter alkanivorans]